MIKKKLLALIAVVISLCALSNTGAFAAFEELPLVEKSWISGDADSEQLGKYIEPFKEYAGDDFNENSFFILQMGCSGETMNRLDKNTNNKLCIEITTNSTQELNIAMARYIDQDVLTSVGIPAPATGYYGYDSKNSNSINTSNTFTVVNQTPYTIESTWLYDALWCALRYGFQVLNEEDLTAGTTITLEYYGINYGTDNTLNERVDLDTITYTFTGSGWVAETDAGYYYMDAQTKYGVIRFLFDSGVDASKITESGIKYIKGSNITDYVDGTTAAVAGGTGTASAFYGDITEIPEANADTTYYAVAYVTTTDGTKWSKVVSCKPNFGSLVEYSEGGNAQ